MAKRSRKDEDDESGRESEEEALSAASSKPAKKPKKSPKDKKSEGKKGNVGKNVSVNSDGEKFVDLGRKRRATVRTYQGKALIDIREFYGDEGDEKPGKKGISLSVEQWEELKHNMSAIDGFIKALPK